MHNASSEPSEISLHQFLFLLAQLRVRARFADKLIPTNFLIKSISSNKPVDFYNETDEYIFLAGRNFQERNISLKLYIWAW